MSKENKITVEPSILTREFNAPRHLVFDAWTQVEHLKNWMFPQKGFTCEYVVADIKPGGSSLHKMIAPNGREMWLLTKYEELNPPESERSHATALPTGFRTVVTGTPAPTDG